MSQATAMSSGPPSQKDPPGDLTWTDDGSGPIKAGAGTPMNLSAGPATTTAAGFVSHDMGGYGYPAANGHPHGSPGDMAAIT